MLQDEIQLASENDQLMEVFFQKLAKIDRSKQPDWFDQLAADISSGNLALFTGNGWATLERKQEAGFWTGLLFFCDLIPKLGLDHSTISRLVVTLVDQAGQDMAARTPLTALKYWCQNNPEEASKLIESAESGDENSIRGVGEALEALCSVERALALSDDAHPPELRTAAVSALGHMEFAAEVAEGVSSTLKSIVESATDLNLRNTALLSCFKIAEKFPDETGDSRQQALAAALKHDSPEDRHALAHMVSRHSAVLSDEQLKKIFSALEDVTAEQSGTLSILDHVTPDLVKQMREGLLCDYIGRIITLTQGAVKFEDVPLLRNELITGSNTRLTVLTVDWLLNRDFHCRNALTELLGRVGEDEVRLTIQPDVLPGDATDQYLLCRKAIGFFFMHPATAASVLVSILEHGDTSLHKKIEELLFDPLLLSYGGELVTYLAGTVPRLSTEAGEVVTNALSRHKTMIRDQDGADMLCELWPTEQQRQTEHLRHQERMKESMKVAESKSILRALASKQCLLYGKASTTYIDDGAGSMKPVEMQMGQLSVAMEYPSLDILDPVGLQMKLHHFRWEERVSG